MLEWKIPNLTKNGGQTYQVADYFPELYYCLDFENKIDAIFLNTNSGGGGDTQYRNYLKKQINSTFFLAESPEMVSGELAVFILFVERCSRCSAPAGISNDV